MNPETTLRAAPKTESVEYARRLAARTMRTWSLLEAEEPVTAIVAELVANAVRHAGTALELRLVHADGMIRIEVSDRDERLPILRVPQAEDEGGRGLYIVDRYSTAWGTTPAPGGKVVWAEISLGTSPRP
ncbi:MAG: ATP-binding protein [Streptosporangiaceae bacterium]